MTALEEKLPRRYWVDINRLLVPFGKHICTGHLPKCSGCPCWTCVSRLEWKDIVKGFFTATDRSLL